MTLDQIAYEVCNKLNIGKFQLKSKKRLAIHVEARAQFAKLARKHGHGVQAIGKYLGICWTSVCHYVNKRADDHGAIRRHKKRANLEK